jgi:hypothetical protein
MKFTGFKNHYENLNLKILNNQFILLLPCMNFSIQNAKIIIIKATTANEFTKSININPWVCIPNHT